MLIVPVAASGFFHLQSTEPLFNQLVALGGSALIQPLPPQAAEAAFGIVTGALGLDKLDPSEQVKALVALPAQDLFAKLAGVSFPLAAVVDGDIVKSTPSVSTSCPVLREFVTYSGEDEPPPPPNTHKTFASSSEKNLICLPSSPVWPMSTP